MDTRFDPSRLESLLESAKLLNSSLRLDDMLSHLLRTVMGRLLVRKGAIAMERSGHMEIQQARGLANTFAAGSPLDDALAAQAGLELRFPIGDPPVGLLALGRPLKGSLEEGEREFVEALLGLASLSIANARAHEETLATNRSLDQKIQELRALLDLVRGLAATTDPGEVARLLALTLAGRWTVLKYAIVTWKPEQPPIERVKGLTLPPLDQIRAASNASDLGLPPGSQLFPIRAGDELTGAVILGPRLGNRAYTEADLEFGAGLVAQASVALENAWHFRQTLEKKQIERELEVAAGIQRDLFPKALPAIPHTGIAARNRQAKQVGGDYYDVLPCGGETIFCVADISGKGISAALLMSIIQATLRALATPSDSLAAIAARTNDLLWASTPASKYATAFFVRYDAATGRCVYVNGGHNDAIVLRASGEVELLGTTGLPVGLFPRREFEEASVTLAAGDLMLIYSDGASEANDHAQEEFGMERLIDSLKAAAPLPPEEILTSVLAAIDEFVNGAPQSDDITLLVVKRQ
jgi:sigma-B regulation protein RsbU (phosphoserine phosphatase)